MCNELRTYTDLHRMELRYGRFVLFYKVCHNFQLLCQKSTMTFQLCCHFKKDVMIMLQSTAGLRPSLTSQFALSLVCRIHFLPALFTDPHVHILNKISNDKCRCAALSNKNPFLIGLIYRKCTQESILSGSLK